MRLYALLLRRARPTSWIVLVAFLVAAPGIARGATDEVLEWNSHLITSILTGATSPLASTRVAAIVHAAIFDAVNGIEGHYRPIHVESKAPNNASARAAAIQAAYASLVKIYPPQAAALLAKRDAAIAALSAGKHGESSKAISRGVEWGQRVADEIWEWRSGDGFLPNPPPPFRGANVVGVWRPTPPANADGAGPNFASMTPWALTRASQFRPGPPPALSSPEYLADYNEVKEWGGTAASMRSADDDVMTYFWTGNTVVFWNRVTSALVADEDRSLLNSARRLALLNVAMADAGIACWDAKYRYVFWRPITAITTDDLVPATTSDPSWVPWLVTPNHPEYLSGHSTLSGAAVRVLTTFFGDDVRFQGVTEALYQGAPIDPRTFDSFSEALAEIHNARIQGGIHFRTACRIGSEVGTLIADYVLRNSMRRGDDDHD
jgi:hypothetical protein